MFQNESNHVRRRTALAQGPNKCDFDEEKKSIVSLATFTRKPPMYDLGDTRNQFLSLESVRHPIALSNPAWEHRCAGSCRRSTDAGT